MGLFPRNPSNPAAMADAALDLVREAPPAAPAEVEALLERVTEQLAARFPHAEHGKVATAALAGWAQAEGERTRCHIDLAASTPYLLYIVDPTAGRRHPVPLTDLLRILGPRISG